MEDCCTISITSIELLTETFTIEDSDLGTTENPLTRNRYDYTTNNPLNYSDSTGHSLWSRIKSTAKKVAKKVVKAAKTVIKTVKNVVKTVKCL